MEILIVTGLSGAGKSCAVKVFEDIGFYCVDNTPPELLHALIDICAANGDYDRIAIAIDIRVGKHIAEVADICKKLHDGGINLRIVFFEAFDEIIIKRYKETRRSHPLLIPQDDNILTAIKKEYELLAPMRELASFNGYLINTSLMSTSKLKEEIVKLFLEKPTDSMQIKVSSYGFKFGADSEADLNFDVRCLPNPFYIRELKNHTGLDRDVVDFVMMSENSQTLLAKIKDFLDFTIPLYLAEGKTRLVISFGCTGGKHRSVTFAELIGDYLANQDYCVIKNHRDIKR